MFYEVAKDKTAIGDYRVEAINNSGDGEVFVTIFSGPDAKDRAEEYASWKNGAAELQKAS